MATNIFGRSGKETNKMALSRMAKLTGLAVLLLFAIGLVAEVSFQYLGPIVAAAALRSGTPASVAKGRTSAVTPTGTTATASLTGPAKPTAQASRTATTTSTPVPLGADWQQTKPNELGRILILEYHELGPMEGRWMRSYANFWHDLEMLYAKGYRPIGLNDIIDNHIDVPAAYSPVVLTFDDSSPMQMNFLQNADGSVTVDPQSAVGMLERFHQMHPDWALKGTFFVLPGADHPHDLFGQEEFKQQKLQHLVKDGFEIGNHTFWHLRLDKLDTRQAVDEQLGRAVQVIQQAVPGYQVRSLALPLGFLPKDPTWAYAGSYQGTDFRNELIMLATGGPARSPNDAKFDPYDVPRIQATNMEVDFEKVYVDYYVQHPDERYVSDGNPDLVVFPSALAGRFKTKPGYRQLQLPPAVAQDYTAVKVR
ncbi:MAG: polysaccharide deacetylase family protein [Dehalococcoidales bacterium]|nr:polysaccharide deacetylase family protein [Dehalococcoidales bacterium]